MTCVETGWESPPDLFAAKRLERVFNDCFIDSFNTCLIGGADEPLYQPAQRRAEHHVLRYRADYFASALHEVAHWCIAGERRRRLLDFGYWYAPEGRCLDQQRAFEAVECKPQALEWFFSRACDYQFQVSADNLELAARQDVDTMSLQRGVLEQVRRWQADGLPQRAGVFYRALCEEFGTNVSVGQLQFSLADLL